MSAKSTKKTAKEPKAITDPFLTVTQVAEILGLSKTATYALLNNGDLSYHRLGKIRRVRQSVLDKYIADAEVRR